jgi:hypothetical protein
VEVRSSGNSWVSPLGELLGELQVIFVFMEYMHGRRMG